MRRNVWRPRRIQPGPLFLLGLFAIVLLGAGLLLLPASTPPGAPLPPIDAVFTSASAVCVTGLTIRDTGGGFTGFGQTVILLLIQIGGIGVMTVSATLAMLFGRGIGMRGASMMRDVFEGDLLKESRGILRFVTVHTLILEATGAVLLFAALGDTIADPLARAQCAVFHAVSAFCNAGFSTWSDSLVSQAGDPLVIGTVSALLITGGLGFPVTANVVAWLKGRARADRTPRCRLYMQARVVLLMSLILLAGGAALLAALEWNGAFAGLAPDTKLGLAFFQSATARTAGFNTMDLTQLSPASVLVMLVLMYIGAAPGSTGGGIKVTTVAILWADARAIALGGSSAHLFDRELNQIVVRRAFMVATSYTTVVALAFGALLSIEGGGFVETIFEVLSALGTVGLTLGLTTELSDPGRLLVTLLMMLGRLGPLAVAYGLVRPTRERGVHYPEATILVG
jgi:trk system potassium uptake protein TrkH